MIEVMSASETTESLWPLLGPKDSKTSQNIKTAKITDLNLLYKTEIDPYTFFIQSVYILHTASIEQYIDCILYKMIHIKL